MGAWEYSIENVLDYSCLMYINVGLFRINITIVSMFLCIKFMQILKLFEKTFNQLTLSNIILDHLSDVTLLQYILRIRNVEASLCQDHD